MNSINYGGISAELPKNMTRVLIENIDGILEFAFYKDGMFKCESDGEYLKPMGVRSWIEINKLKLKLGI
jgi:hypothetical protein